jgi:hypothetical protein
MSEKQQTRREFIKKVAYVAPAILTLPALPSIASAGSGYEYKDKYKDKDKDKDKKKR